MLLRRALPLKHRLGNVKSYILSLKSPEKVQKLSKRFKIKSNGKGVTHFIVKLSPKKERFSKLFRCL